MTSVLGIHSSVLIVYFFYFIVKHLLILKNVTILPSYKGHFRLLLFTHSTPQFYQRESRLLVIFYGAIMVHTLHHATANKDRNLCYSVRRVIVCFIVWRVIDLVMLQMQEKNKYLYLISQLIRHFYILIFSLKNIKIFNNF